LRGYSQILAEFKSLFANFLSGEGDSLPTLLKQTLDFSIQHGNMSMGGTPEGPHRDEREKGEQHL
jgi:hypothetical protein